MRRLRTCLLALSLSLLMVVGFVFSNGCCHHIVRAVAPTSVHDQIAKHFVSINLINDQTGALQPIGSGVYIELDGEPYVLTAYHVWGLLSYVSQVECVSVCHNDTCVCFEENTQSINTPFEDWALVKMPYKIPGTTPAKVNTDLLAIGSTVYTAGYPNGIRLMTSGEVAGYSTLPTEPFIHYMINGYAYFGSSGGGVFDNEGMLVGIIEAIDVFREGGEASPNPNIYYVVPVREMAPLTE